MECNKDEAVRAKGIAENKLLERDFVGAEKFALKAQSLFPELDGLSQFLEIINVHVAHEKKINGVTDYYGIFGVDPFADEKTLRDQYKRMARSLHPDKNKSVGANGAFQIMSQAWSVLSDKDKRNAYDLTVNIRSSSQTATSQSCSSASYHQRNTASGSQHIRTPQCTPAAATVVSSSYTPAPHHSRNSRFGTSTKHTAATGLLHNPALNMNVPNFKQSPVFAVPPNPRNTTRPSGNPSLIRKFQRPPLPAFASQNVPFRNQMASNTCLSRPETFWTLCNKCAIQYEYQNIFLNQNLLCRRCMQPFLATAMPAPPVKSRSSHPCPFPNQRQQEMPTASPPSASRTSQAPLPQPSKKHTKRRHEVAINNGSENNPPMKNSCSVSENVEAASASYTAPPGLNREKPVKRRRKDSQKCDGSKEGSQGAAGSGVYSKKASATMKENSGAEQSRSMKELSQTDIRAMLMRKAKTEIHRQLNEWEKKKLNASHLNRQDMSNIVHALGKNSINRSQTKERQILQPRETSTLNETVVGANPDEFVSMSVPDANFHNFDDDRIEKSFTQNQVWAAYDDDDGMPRYYAMVHSIISRSPFKMQINWLNSKSSSEFGSLDWIASGFTKTTGNFRPGKFVVSERLNSFSHPVKWKKGSRGVIQILPTKGDVWALYRNWSADWNETTADETIHKYDLVVVLQDYDEDTGVLVVPLVKVAGFTSVFNQLSDHRGIRTIPREEMFRFSHQVPFYLLNGLEAENAPKNCYELDPAALPLELLNVITDDESAARIDVDPEMRPGLGNETMAETCSTKTNANQRSRVEDPKYVFTYCRRNKEKKIEGDVGQSKH
ncbi:hypothetical protein C2S53_015067 [Perilla frutescens var. hirtella]|uniref:J domain-containing protein n=1 Tax=Perilla frutescens var. hirtella TaxID=608512 RepID=A0AAD4JCZ6_PERFH|nr:hypothetical protein C2S53_015067 [Perilla frutescens var. hirtella]